MAEKQKIRLDKYLWAIRLFKTRTLAAAACENGKVKFDGAQAKPAKNVTIGDEYEIKTATKRWRIRVTGLLEKRMAAAEAVKNYTDITPEEEIQRLLYLRKESHGQAASFHTGKRRSKIGRPTKKERRDLDGFLED